MSVVFGNSIDLDNHQLLNFIVHSANIAPSTPASGMMWWKSDTSLMQMYDTNGWYRIVQGPASSTDNFIPQWDGIKGNRLKQGLEISTIIGTPGVDTKIPTEKAVRDAINATSITIENLSQTNNGGINSFIYNGSSPITIGLNFTNLTNETVLANTDEFAYYDASASAMRALTYSALKTALSSELIVTTDTFKTLSLTADSGYTWGTANVIAVNNDTLKLVAGANVVIESDSTSKAIRISATTSGSGTSDHGALTGLLDDDHTQYVKLTGRSGDILKIDNINEFTLNTGVTIDGLLIKDGGIPDSAITFTDVTTGNATEFNHGYLPKLAMVADQYLRSNGTWAVPPNTTYSVITTAEIDGGVSTTSRVLTGARAKYIIDKSVPIAHLTDFAHNNIANGQTAFGWGNHQGLYSLVTHVHSESEITFTDITTNNASDTKHGYLPKLSMEAGKFLRADGTWVTPPDTTYSEITTTDIDGGTASTLRTITGRRAKYIIDKCTPIAHITDFNHSDFIVTSDSRLTNARPASDVYAWAKAVTKPTYAESEISFTDITTGNASDTMHGYLPKLSMIAGQFLRADGTWQTPTGTTYTVISTAEIDAGTSTNERIITAQRIAYIIGKSTPIGHLTDFNHGNFVTTSDSRLSDARVASDVYSWAKAATKPTYTHTEVGAAAASHNQAETTITFTDITTGNASEFNHGYLPKLSMVAGQFLRADGTWQTPAGTTYTEISTAEIDAGSSSTLRTISGRRAGYIIGKSTPIAHATDYTNPHSVTATQVGLGNVTNESKATMFTNPTFTGAVTIPSTEDDGTYTGIVTNDTGVLKYRTISSLKSDMSLQNVTNESKATMFTNPVFTGNVGIGTTTPSTKLEIVNGNDIGINWKFNTGFGNSNISNVFDSGADSGNMMQFNVNTAAGTATTRLTILGNGNTGFGLTPFAKITIPSGYSYTGMIGFEASADSGSRRWWIHTDYNAYGDFNISTESSKQQGANPTTPRFVINPNGTITVGSTITASNFILSSDERLKENIQPISLTGVNIDYKQFNLISEPNQLRYGVIAQELQKTNPELVREDDKGMLSVAYIDLLIKEVVSLKQRVSELEGRVS